jgi:hypothetical protein
VSLRSHAFLVTGERSKLIREIQDHCADLLASEREWDMSDGHYMASLFNRDNDPTGLFLYMDELTGSHNVMVPRIGHYTFSSFRTSQPVNDSP